MSAIRDEQKQNVSAFMSEFWSGVVKPYYNPEERDEYWMPFVEKVMEIAKKYGNGDERIIGMVLGFLRGAEKMNRMEKDKAQGTAQPGGGDYQGGLP